MQVHPFINCRPIYFPFLYVEIALLPVTLGKKTVEFTLISDLLVRELFYMGIKKLSVSPSPSLPPPLHPPFMTEVFSG